VDNVEEGHEDETVCPIRKLADAGASAVEPVGGDNLQVTRTLTILLAGVPVVRQRGHPYFSPWA
jgi:hypothetical protein